MAVRYLADRIRVRVQAVHSGDPESGALTLEWIIIAALVAGLAVTAGVAFRGAVTNYIGQLP
jgi:hypothetical protein